MSHVGSNLGSAQGHRRIRRSPKPHRRHLQHLSVQRLPGAGLSRVCAAGAAQQQLSPVGLMSQHSAQPEHDADDMPLSQHGAAKLAHCFVF
jgi:hypothetical protein